MNEPPQNPIFFDETRRRGNLFTALFFIVSILGALAAIAAVVTIAFNPTMSPLPLTRATSALDVDHAQKPAAVRVPGRNGALDLKKRVELRYVIRKNQSVQEAKRRLSAAIRLEAAALPIPASAIAPGHLSRPVRAAFYVNWDKPSLDSLVQHIGETTHFIPSWLHIGSDGKTLVRDRQLTSDAPGYDGKPALSETSDDTAQRLAHQNGVAILPMVQNADGSKFHNDWLHKLLSSPARRTDLVAHLLSFVTQGHYQGINVDFETDQADDRAGMTAFMTELASAFHPRGLLVTQDVQTDSDAYALGTLAKVNDFLVPMLYDEHASGDNSGPIASQSWYVSHLKDFMTEVPADKVVLGIGNYGYDWTAGDPNSEEVSFEKACQVAQESRDDDDGIIKIDPKSLNPYYTYYDGPTGQGDKHTVWLMDATTAFNEMRAAQPYHTLGAALWRLGTEDPSVWSFFGKNTADLTQFDTNALQAVTYKYFGTQFLGYGDVLYVAQKPTNGVRKLVVKNGLITGETFVKYPSQYVIRRTGLVDEREGDNAGKNLAKKIALTFDDGPDPRWTPQILDILHHYHVPATFFVVGQNAQAHPGLIAREWNEGMEIGNHSFTHPEMDKVSLLRTNLELNATQRVIEAITGHQTTLFRAPNRADSEPSSVDDLAPILEAQKLGYLFIGESNDPTDWLPGITSTKIVQSVLNYTDTKNDGNAILLHDAGGDTRQPTIDALPKIIEGLQKRGYTFVTVSQLVGQTKAQVFPEVTGKQRMAVLLDRFVFNVTYWLGNGFALLFLTAIFLGLWRIVFMGSLAAVQARREKARVFSPNYQPTVSVIIAAYNEAKVINKTIATLLSSEYPNLEIVVVDDGSKDDTAGVVGAAYGGHPQITVLTKENGGKASALNIGIRQCRGEIVVALDADTVFAPDTIGKLVRHFSDPDIGAVSGNVKVGNRTNPLTIWQAVEYITSQNFDRRAFDLLNCITVVPGAIGAWRKDAIVLAGLYSSQTLAEDTDLTFKVRKLGYRIVTDNAALAYTEAPDTLRNLAKQRFRWAFGTLQCLWKHRAALMNPRYGAFGMVAMPSLWVYQIAFQAIAPIVDIAIAWTLFFGTFITPTANHQDIWMLLGYWGVFSTVEMLGGLLAFRLDRENPRLLLWLLLQRFVYRQLMYYVIVKSLVVAVRGSLVGWGKFERRGNVTQPAAKPPVVREDKAPTNTGK